MRFKYLFVILSFFVASASLALSTELTRQPWVAFVFVLFSGCLIFDFQKEMTKTWVRIFGVIFFFIFVQASVVSEGVEEFWRLVAGAFLVLAFMYDQNSFPWRGPILRYSALLPSIVFSLLAYLHGTRFVPATVGLTCGLFCLLILAFYEFFIFLRHRSEMIIGSFLSSFRMALAGITALFYGKVFLPSAFQTPPFTYFILFLPAVAIIMGVLSLTTSDMRRRHMIFASVWSLLIIWGSVSGESGRFFAATLACLFGSWSIGMMSEGATLKRKDVRNLLYISGWCVPGSFLFTCFALLIYPSAYQFVQIGSVLWLVVVTIFGLSLTYFDWSYEKDRQAWSWQINAAVVVNIFGVCLLGLMRFLPDLGMRYWEGFR